MNITSVNFINKVTAQKFAQNPINFKGLEQNDSVELSQEAKLALEIKRVENKLKEFKEKFRLLSKALDKGENIEYSKKHAEFFAPKSKYLLHSSKLEGLWNRYLELYKQYDAYLTHLKTHPLTAFLYNPETNIWQKREQLKNTPELMGKTEFFEKYFLSERKHLTVPEVKEIFEAGQWEIDKCNNAVYFDVTHPANVKAAEEVKAKIKEEEERIIREAEETSIIKTEEERYPFLSIGVKYNLSEAEVRAYRYGRMDLQRHIKLTPQPSPLYSQSVLKNSQANAVPIKYLSRLGFGEPEEILALVKQGKIKSTIVEKDTKEGRKKFRRIDITDLHTERVLMIQREDNKSIKTLKQLAKLLDMTPQELEEAIVDDRLEIIPEFVFKVDYKNRFVDLGIQKNANFVESRLFELERQKEASTLNGRARSSLRMKLAWYFCPKTKEKASSVALKMPWVWELFSKRDKMGFDALDENEQAILKGYYKEMWTQAGLDEFRSALDKASRTLEVYDNRGLEAIRDKGAREIIEQYV